MSKKQLNGPTPLQLVSLNPKNKNIVFQLDDNLFKPDGDVKDFGQLPVELQTYILSYYPPTIMKLEHNIYGILAGHLSYKLMTAETKYEHSPNFRLLSNNYANLKELIQQCDKSEHDHITSIIASALSPKKTSPSTNCRCDAKVAGQICPKCGQALLGPRNSKPLHPDSENKTYRITCFNAHQKYRDGRKRCDFYADLNAYEYDLFKQGKFPTQKWLEKLDHGQCPHTNCNGVLYVRTIYASENEYHKIVECQNCNYSLVKKCDFQRKLEEWQPQLKIF